MNTIGYIIFLFACFNMLANARHGRNDRRHAKVKVQEPTIQSSINGTNSLIFPTLDDKVEECGTKLLELAKKGHPVKKCLIYDKFHLASNFLHIVYDNDPIPGQCKMQELCCAIWTTLSCVSPLPPGICNEMELAQFNSWISRTINELDKGKCNQTHHDNSVCSDFELDMKNNQSKSISEECRRAISSSDNHLSIIPDPGDKGKQCQEKIEAAAKNASSIDKCYEYDGIDPMNDILGLIKEDVEDWGHIHGACCTYWRYISCLPQFIDEICEAEEKSQWNEWVLTIKIYLESTICNDKRHDDKFCFLSLGHEAVECDRKLEWEGINEDQGLKKCYPKWVTGEVLPEKTDELLDDIIVADDVIGDHGTQDFFKERCCHFWTRVHCLAPFSEKICDTEEKNKWNDWVVQATQYLEQSNCNHTLHTDPVCNEGRVPKTSKDIHKL